MRPVYGKRCDIIIALFARGDVSRADVLPDKWRMDQGRDPTREANVFVVYRNYRPKLDANVLDVPIARVNKADPSKRPFTLIFRNMAMACGVEKEF